LSHSGISPLRRVVGFSLIIVGLVLFLILIPFLMPLGLAGAFLLTWLVVICVGVGSFVLSRVRFRVAAKSFFIVLALSIPWFAIFLLLLPSDIQLLLAVSVAFIAVLIYRYSIKNPISLPKNLQRSSCVRKVAGVSLTIASVLMYVVVFSLGIQYGLLVAMTASLPVFFLALVGCSLILGSGLKRVALWGIMFAALTMMPWIVVLPTVWQAVSLAILGIVLTLILLWYRKKWKPSASYEQREDSD